MKTLWRLLVVVLLCSCGLVVGARSADNDQAAAEALIERLKEHPADIRAEELRVDLLLRAIGRQGGVNIVVAENITDTITLELRDLSLYELFRFVLDTRQLHYRRQNNIILVEKRADFQARRQDLLTVRLCARYGRAAQHLEQLSPLLTPAGTITVTGQGDCLIIKDRENNLPHLEQMLAELDRPVPQVHIEARIVTVTNEAKKRLGVVWGYDALWKYDDRSPGNPVSFSADLPVVAPTTNLAFGFLRDSVNLGLTIQAMQEENLLELLSAPGILVLNGEEAEIKQGKEIPYVSQSGDLVNTSFREANLSLKVTPLVIQDAFINLAVRVTNDSVDNVTSSSGSGEPLINKQEIGTKLFLEDGATVVIGGIIIKNRDRQSSEVPGLAALPLLGRLFKSSRKSDEESELLVFLTPTIVNLEDGGRPAATFSRKVLGRQDEAGVAGAPVTAEPPPPPANPESPRPIPAGRE